MASPLYFKTPVDRIFESVIWGQKRTLYNKFTALI